MDIVTKETFKAKVQKLVEHFSDNEEYYKSKEYKEDHLRQEFINPFFKALGWDMDNEQGFAPQYREVIHEDRIEIEGKPKAPDYAFKVGSDRKFFVEAKASSVRVFSEIDPAFQLRRYAWSGQLPVSILTDFEEFSIYDTTIEPKHTDKSSVARVKYIYYTDYLKEIDYLWDTFSKEAVWRGSFDKFAKKEKKGSQLVDRSFLKEIELWRELIAKDIASNNSLNIYELNSVVQKFIDRIIFLRIAEDRGVETYETLRNAVKSPDTYSQLLHIFKRADEKYNSSLFDLKKDEISTRIKISDKTLDRILNNLYYPKSPYEFSVIGVDILGSVYEQFLGKVIRLTKGGNAVIEEKPEVKKAGGVYYTPQYIVDYIVKNTVGELVKDKTPKDVAKLKIVDPACGSGSFLIGAYNYLLNWHHKYYVENDVERNLKSKKLFKDAEGNYFLSTQEKKDILLNNIHGVDIDPQAVEVTKLSLALKMLEGENSETIGAQFVMFADRILPDLSSNIKCGNSLIGSDYYSDKQITLLGDEELRKVNAFDWDKEFPLVFRYGGFDAVIGNPPYVRQETLKDSKQYWSRKFTTFHGQADLYVYFIEQSYLILKESGLYGVIVSNKWLKSNYAKDLRKFLVKYSLKQIVDFGDLPVFGAVSAYPCIIISSKGISSGNGLFKATTLNNLSFSNLEDEISISNNSLKTDLLDEDGWFLVSSQEHILLKKLKKIDLKLVDFINKKIFVGLKTGLNRAFVLSEDIALQMIKEDKRYEEIVKPYVAGREIKKYGQLFPSSYVIAIPSGWSRDKGYGSFEDFNADYPLVAKHLRQFIDDAKKRSDQGEFWWELRACAYYNEFLKTKIIYPEISLVPQFTIDKEGYYCDMTANIITEAPLYLLGMLNSELMAYYFKNISSSIRGGFLRWKRQYMEMIPLCIPNSIEQNKLEILITECLDLSVRIGLEKGIKNSVMKKRLGELNEEINLIVYELYGIDQKEIFVIRKSLQS